MVLFYPHTWFWSIPSIRFSPTICTNYFPTEMTSMKSVFTKPSSRTPQNQIMKLLFINLIYPCHSYYFLSWPDYSTFWSYVYNRGEPEKDNAKKILSKLTKKTWQRIICNVSVVTPFWPLNPHQTEVLESLIRRRGGQMAHQRKSTTGCPTILFPLLFC